MPIPTYVEVFDFILSLPGEDQAKAWERGQEWAKAAQAQCKEKERIIWVKAENFCAGAQCGLQAYTFSLAVQAPVLVLRDH